MKTEKLLDNRNFRIYSAEATLYSVHNTHSIKVRHSFYFMYSWHSISILVIAESPVIEIISNSSRIFVLTMLIYCLHR